MSRWSLGRGATLSLLIAGVLIVSLASLLLRETRQLLEAHAWVRHTLEVLMAAQEVRTALTTAESVSRGYALIGDETLAHSYDESAERVRHGLATLHTLAAERALPQQQLAQLEQAASAKLAWSGDVIELRRRGGEPAAVEKIQTGLGLGLMKQALAASRAFEDAERATLQERIDARERQSRSLNALAAALGGLGVLMLGGAAYLLNRSFTSQAAAERLARLEATRLQVTLQSCGDGLIATDPVGQIVFMNPVAQALTGWRQEDARGLPLDHVFRIVNEFTRETVESPLGKVLREGKVVGLANHTTLIARDGTERPIDDSGAPILDEQGELHGMILVFRDVSSRKLSEQARERLLRAEAERDASLAANRAKDDFLAVLSHELRNPLAAMLGWVEVLKSGALGSAELARAIGAIERSALQQRRLVSDLLDVSRIIADRLPIERGPLDLDALVASSVASHRSDAEARGVLLSHTGAGGPLLVAGDPERLDQVIGNLVSNALKFTDPGGRVEVALQRIDGRARIHVSDTGIGMSREQLDRIFDRFWQAASSRVRRQEGLGLGLAIVQHIVNGHEGTVRAESDGVGLGARFIVEIPLETGVAPRTSPPPPRADALERTLAGVRVLLVDDEAEGREALAMLLTVRGAQVREADSAAAAMRELAAGAFDIVVTDIAMPRQDGYALLAQIRQLDKERARRTPALAVTGFATREDREAVLGAGFDGHVAKPVEVEALVRRVLDVLRSG
ncbi:MAG: hypothetical protein DCC71_03910 [Proteobacteria bacterium]|nr:MAG: hypothetical protein DCC71_03910 [Pseudomonadota bacterium]